MEGVHGGLQCGLLIVKCRPLGGQLHLASGKALLKMLQAGPLRPLLGLRECEFVLAQCELPLGIHSGRKALLRRHLLCRGDAGAWLLRRAL